MARVEQSALEYSQCQEAVKKLTEYLSHELGPDEEEKLKEHLSECRGCFSRRTITFAGFFSISWLPWKTISK